ncbi:MAG TPA: DCC1-like thiol-disulfide oxidoreductase family protein [Thermoanaerobaculia bacterium]|nr:DCC1-like thiol-disulfide oxidoreductase family protein [Thermoanaerobaculia bacterium]
MVTTLYILYDARCGLCSRVREWSLLQPAFVTLDFIPAGSERARTLFPTLAHEVTPSELVVVTSEGEVYFDTEAWIVCLWALREYRAWSRRFASGPLRPLARTAWHLICENRAALSRMFSLRSDEEIARRLGAQPAPACEWN